MLNLEEKQPTFCWAIIKNKQSEKKNSNFFVN